ncbi:MAG: restriction endonuclease [Pseudomonadota bacterium]|nr:restriction endonuclease [Pseudomonadota bacterium]
MGAGVQWFAAILVLLLVGGAATFYIRTVLLRGHEAAAGIAALSAMTWRDFIHLVLESLTRRGYRRVGGDDAPTRDGEYLLVRDGERWLMSCKHGSAYVLGAVAVTELADDLRLSSATGGLLVTQGRIAEDAHGIARLRHIELLDGPTLWPRVRDLIPPDQLAQMRGEAKRRTRTLTLLAWLAALLAAGGVIVMMPQAAPTPEGAALPANAPAPVTRSVPQAPTGDVVEDITPMPDEATLELQRKDVANAISTLPMVDRATWPTRSTLEVFLLETQSDAVALICPLMERYPGLAASRIQLTPPQGSQAPVRFRQCRVY